MYVKVQCPCVGAYHPTYSFFFVENGVCFCFAKLSLFFLLRCWLELFCTIFGGESLFTTFRLASVPSRRLIRAEMRLRQKKEGKKKGNWLKDQTGCGSERVSCNQNLWGGGIAKLRNEPCHSTDSSFPNTLSHTAGVVRAPCVKASSTDNPQSIRQYRPWIKEKVNLRFNHGVRLLAAIARSGWASKQQDAELQIWSRHVTITSSDFFLPFPRQKEEVIDTHKGLIRGVKSRQGDLWWLHDVE